MNDKKDIFEEITDIIQNDEGLLGQATAHSEARDIASVIEMCELAFASGFMNTWASLSWNDLQRADWDEIAAFFREES